MSRSTGTRPNFCILRNELTVEISKVFLYQNWQIIKLAVVVGPQLNWNVSINMISWGNRHRTKPSKTNKETNDKLVSTQRTNRLWFRPTSQQCHSATSSDPSKKIATLKARHWTHKFAFPKQTALQYIAIAIERIDNVTSNPWQTYFRRGSSRVGMVQGDAIRCGNARQTLGATRKLSTHWEYVIQKLKAQRAARRESHTSRLGKSRSDKTCGAAKLTPPFPPLHKSNWRASTHGSYLTDNFVDGYKLTTQSNNKRERRNKVEREQKLLYEMWRRRVKSEKWKKGDILPRHTFFVNYLSVF